MHIGLVSRGDLDYALDLANELRDAGSTVTLYLSRAHVQMSLNLPDLLVEGLYERGLLYRDCRVRLIRLPRMRNPRSLFVLRDLSRSIEDDGVDVAHILLGPDEFWFAVLASLLRRTPTVLTMIVPKPNIGQRFPFAFIWGVQKLAAISSDVVIVNGADQVQLVERLYRVSATKIYHVPLSIRPSAWIHKQRDERAFEETSTILFFGRADSHKGLEYLVEAQPFITNRLPTARIIISAHGPELTRCRALIHDESKFEILDGFVSEDEMANLFERSTVVVAPYLTASTSGVIIRAHSHETPVVATRVGSIPEYIEDGITGLLVEPRNARQLADALVSILANRPLRARMKQNIRQMLKGRRKRIAKQTLDAYIAALKVHNGSFENPLPTVR